MRTLDLTAAGIIAALGGIARSRSVERAFPESTATIEAGATNAAIDTPAKRPVGPAVTTLRGERD